MAKSKKATAPQAAKTFDATEKNRARRLAKHLKRHENDEQAKKAAASPAPVRSKPVSKGSVSKLPKYRVFANDVDGKVAVDLETYTEAELFHRGRMKPQDYESQVRKMRQPTAEVLKASRGSFGKFSLNIFGIPYNREDVRAVCHHLQIKFGTSDKPRGKRQAKRK
ncbi:hypothetical protein KAMAJI_01550 [Serratia phage vB_SmaM-Kamaji]|nr:hypothetical protein KAMAJI_01550 [Serratia phage vB_SmaM-Kamaji]